MTMFAAYDDLSIYSVHATAEGALAKAKADAGAPDATFSIALIADDLAAWILKHGWNGNTRSFDIGRDGYIIDTTDQDEDE